ncbi:MAG: hypothetical protein KF791_17630 [Verrucomicrobiae bacterium]|nr:hypothetical protein [Verrucomicrobiae bacterium]
MTRLSLILGAWLLLLPGTAGGAEPVIRKVLPHLVDTKGRISVAPGLFDRSAYQQHLRENPSKISAVRFDIQWAAPRSVRDQLTLRMELRTARGEPGMIRTIEAPTRDNRRLGGWSSVLLDGDQYREGGEVLAWRAVLLDGAVELAEQRSFLW